MFLPVDKSIIVSAPQRHAQTAFSTSSSIVEVTALLPMLALIFTKKLRPTIIGSLSGWLMLFGIMARPLATSLRTNSGVIFPTPARPEGEGVFAPQLFPSCWCCMALVCSFINSKRWFSRMAMYSISGVMIPCFA